MKKSGRCPKCESTRIHRSPWTWFMRGRNQVPVSFWRAAKIEMYICVDCGFVERYVGDASDLARIAQNWPKAR